ncbi:uncharacterized protein LOC126267190 isoform X1 [Schistocerca gregaria]|uniref:uncharacterized protein LOC126267190 isoform X1 n=1 Tax=Schistocerca gregaria TaxID=7010 RepID=UPI00211F288E|nr:uncharacterized protein LOC126267190 isoform X1 [Schistocerca gregaria]
MVAGTQRPPLTAASDSASAPDASAAGRMHRRLQRSPRLLLAPLLAAACLIHAGVVGVTITDMRVPSEVRNGSTAAVVLDCEYSLRPEEQGADSGLVVKWFFNNSPEPVYQWIPGQKPQDLGILRGRLKLAHRASTSHASMHRALYIVRPTTELSGEYRCSVSTFKDEDFMTKKMIVYATEKSLRLQPYKPTGDSVNVSCRAQGVFPEPKMVLYKYSDGDPKPQPMQDVTVSTQRRDGGFDISAHKLLFDRDLPDSATFACELRVPSTRYSVRKSLVYYPGADNPLPMLDNGAWRRRAPPLWSLLIASSSALAAAGASLSSSAARC